MRIRVLAAAAALLIAIAAPLAYFHVARIRSQTIVVTFRLVAPEAQAVHLVGDFSDWSLERLVMSDKDADGVWETSIRLRQGSSYRYNFVVDGERWITDPASVIELQDDFGGTSSVIQL